MKELTKPMIRMYQNHRDNLFALLNEQIKIENSIRDSISETERLLHEAGAPMN